MMEQYPNVVVPQSGRGFFGIGIEYPCTAKNVGTLWRTAHIMKADFMFVIGHYKPVATDTLKSWRHVPLFEYESFGQFYSSLPKDARLVGIELDERSVPLAGYRHPERAVYLLGSETDGLSQEALEHCTDGCGADSRRVLSKRVGGRKYCHLRPAVEKRRFRSMICLALRPILENFANFVVPVVNTGAT